MHFQPVLLTLSASALTFVNSRYVPRSGQIDLKMLDWNLLADGLSGDGFLSTKVYLFYC
jgi:hypothetical protein